jgi:hypothetical protein
VVVLNAVVVMVRWLVFLIVSVIVLTIVVTKLPIPSSTTYVMFLNVSVIVVNTVFRRLTNGRGIFIHLVLVIPYFGTFIFTSVNAGSERIVAFFGETTL